MKGLPASPRGRTAAAAAIAAAALALWLACRPGPPLEVSVAPGLSTRETAELLKKRGVIPSAFVFRTLAQLLGEDRRLKPGTYRMRHRMGALAALRQLAAGASIGVRVSIPEGFSSRQIAQRLEPEGVCRAEDFLKYAEKNRLEGYLFPTTYFFEPGMGAEKAAQMMYSEFKQKIEAEYKAAKPKPRLTLHQLLTLASIVEREAVKNEEKPTIAAVYMNRMRLRMRLEADPTVQFVLGYWKKGLTHKDLQTPSPYNTYMHFGLPPGPICSPGLDSFAGALNPSMTDAIYFVADNKGGHVFSANHEDHVKARLRYKKGLREIKEKLRREQAANGRSGNGKKW